MKNIMNKKRKKVDVFTIILHLFFIVMCACFVIPLILVISASFTSEDWLISGKGFSLIPQEFTTDAYRSAFGNGDRVIRAYIVTIIQAFGGTLLGCVIAGLAAYPISRTNFRFKGPVTGIIFFTMLFGAGMIPNYLVYSEYGIVNTFWVYILPGLTGGAWNTMVFRTFFKGLPESLFESAHLDGARELTIFFRIVVPLSTPVFASIAFMLLVGRWNNYTTSMLYIRDENLYTLQYLLQRLLNSAEFLKSLSKNGIINDLNLSELEQAMPCENLKYAMCVIAAGPMLVIFPFFQKYFSQGLTIGAVKG